MNSNDVNNLSNNGIDKNKLCFVIVVLIIKFL